MDINKLTLEEQHQFTIAQQTMSMPDAIANIMGGMGKGEAEFLLSRLTEKEYLYWLPPSGPGVVDMSAKGPIWAKNEREARKKIREIESLPRLPNYTMIWQEN